MIPSLVGEPLKVVNTLDFLYVNNMNLNRGLSPEGVKRIDPQGIHLIQPIMLHNDHEIRCWAYVKVMNSMEPIEIFFDIPIDYWSLLEEADAYLEPREDDGSEGEEGQRVRTILATKSHKSKVY